MPPTSTSVLDKSSITRGKEEISHLEMENFLFLKNPIKLEEKTSKIKGKNNQNHQHQRMKVEKLQFFDDNSFRMRASSKRIGLESNTRMSFLPKLFGPSLNPSVVAQFTGGLKPAWFVSSQNLLHIGVIRIEILHLPH